MTTHKKIRIFLVLLLTIAIAPLHSTTVYADCHDGPSGPTVSEDFDSLLTYLPDNPRFIAPGTSVALNVEGGTGPYTWTVEGNGYTLASPPQTGTSNTLSADLCTQNPATVTIIDSSSPTQTVTGTLDGNYLALEYIYTPDNQEVAPNSSVEVSVTGGEPPYNWTVSGSGFSIEYSQTTGPTNILYADANACGAGTITVTDVCGAQVIGYARSQNASGWVAIEWLDSSANPIQNGEACGMSAPPDKAEYVGLLYSAPYFRAEKIVGKYRVWEWAVTDDYPTSSENCFIGDYQFCIKSECSHVYPTFAECIPAKPLWCCVTDFLSRPGPHQFYPDWLQKRIKYEWKCN